MFSDSFIAKMPGGHIGIFKRKTIDRLPIKEQYVSLEPEASDVVKNNVERESMTVFMKYFNHEIDYATKGNL